MKHLKVWQRSVIHASPDGLTLRVNEEADGLPRRNPGSILIITDSVWTSSRTSSSGVKTKSQFILSALFDKPVKVVKIDKAATDYYIKLTNLQSEYRRIGVNYNQAVKALHTGLSEKKALAMLYKLEQLTIELISLNREIIRLTQEFEQWLQK